jgi:hypothetical protein
MMLAKRPPNWGPILYASRRLGSVGCCSRTVVCSRLEDERTWAATRMPRQKTSIWSPLKIEEGCLKIEWLCCPSIGPVRKTRSFDEAKLDLTPSGWVKNRIEKYGFVEGVDYHKVVVNSHGPGQKPIDYHATVTMAKELAIVENNDRGRIFAGIATDLLGGLDLHADSLAVEPRQIRCHVV